MSVRAPRRDAPLAIACALAIGGLDPGGGAGLLADMRAFAAAGAFGCAAIALVTVQSTSGLRSATAVASREVIAQIDEVVRHQRVRAIKVGALGSAANVRAVGEWLARHRKLPAIVDTPMLATASSEGARLLASRAVVTMKRELIGHAALVTANAPEAEILVGARVRDIRDARDAAVALCRLGARAALIKGGHLRTRDEAVDVLAIGGEIIELRAPRLRLPKTRGTGCTLASLIAGKLATSPYDGSEREADARVEAVVRWAKQTHHAALERVSDVGGAMKVITFT